MHVPALVVMAAGIGSRFGGLKQVAPVGPNGEATLEYAVFDALRAGFGTVVFVIRRDMESLFRERFGQRIERCAETRYAFQELTDLPSGFAPPPGRERPWGTGHAVLACRGLVSEPFAAINADDFYGRASFRVLADHLRTAQDAPGCADYCMVGFLLRKTLSPHGPVARGVCAVTPDGMLREVVERTRIRATEDNLSYEQSENAWMPLPPDSIASMNMWGFTPSLFAELEARFRRFLDAHPGDLKAEFFLPGVVNELLTEGKARVRVLPTDEQWFGVTYRDDVADFRAEIAARIQAGEYPASLWTEPHPPG